MKSGKKMSLSSCLPISVKPGMRVTIKPAIIFLMIVFNVFLLYSAQDSSANANNVKNSVTTTNQASANVNKDSPANNAGTKKISEVAAHADTSSVLSVKPKDSASKLQLKTDTSNSSRKDTLAKPAKIAAEKKAVIEEEEMLIDEAEEKKSAKENAPVNLHNDSFENAQKKTTAETDSQIVEIPNKEQNTVQENSRIPDNSLQAKPEVKVEKTVKPAAPVIVENVHSINFAKNLKDYKSPKVAMLLSLIVPGLGQAYVKQYVKAGVFVALEATAVGFIIAFNNKGKQQYNNAKSFANASYDCDTMKSYYNKLYNFFLGQEGGSIDTAQGYMDLIYTDSLKSLIKGSSDYYSSIQSNSYVQGWKDCEPSGDIIINGTSDTINGGNYRYVRDSATGYLVYQVNSSTGEIDTNSPLYGYSANQLKYKSMVSKSNDYYKTAQAILFVMLINHVISSVDALISAKAYNDALLGKESFWQHISIEQQFVKAGSANGVGCAMRIQF
jgi:hypothetical protein